MLVSLVAASSSSREKPAREEAVQLEAHSPSSQHQRLSSQQAKQNGSRSEYKAASGCSRSSDNDSPLPSQSLKPDLEEAANAASHKTDEGDSAVLANGTASRCVSGIFAGHGKLKRLLGTLVQFATDISADTGDTVRTLVLALLVSKLAGIAIGRIPSIRVGTSGCQLEEITKIRGLALRSS